MLHLTAFVFGIVTYITGVLVGSWLEHRLKVGRQGFLLGFVFVVILALICLLGLAMLGFE